MRLWQILSGVCALVLLLAGVCMPAQAAVPTTPSATVVGGLARPADAASPAHETALPLPAADCVDLSPATAPVAAAGHIDVTASPVTVPAAPACADAGPVRPDRTDGDPPQPHGLVVVTTVVQRN